VSTEQRENLDAIPRQGTEPGSGGTTCRIPDERRTLTGGKAAHHAGAVGR